jgi:hypothetical protein
MHHFTLLCTALIQCSTIPIKNNLSGNVWVQVDPICTLHTGTTHKHSSLPINHLTTFLDLCLKGIPEDTGRKSVTIERIECKQINP